VGALPTDVSGSIALSDLRKQLRWTKVALGHVVKVSVWRGPTDYNFSDPVDFSILLHAFEQDFLMLSLQEIRDRRRELDAMEKEVIKTEKVRVLAEMKVKIRQLEITAEELRFKLDKPVKVDGAGKQIEETPLKPKPVVKYRNAEGKTRSGGRGRKPDLVKELEKSGGNIEEHRFC